LDRLFQSQEQGKEAEGFGTVPTASPDIASANG